MTRFIRIFRNTATRAEVERHLPGHLDYLRRLRDAGILKAAGPFADRTGGIELLEAEYGESLRKLVEQDPFIVHNLGTWELKPWEDILPGI